MAVVDYYNKYANQINNQYNNAIAGIDKTQEADKLKAQQEYNQVRNQASVNAAKNQMALKEAMANQGLYKSGDNITGQLAINNNRASNINQANLDEQNYNAQLAQERQKQINAYEMARQNALLEALRQNDEWQYRDNRDVISDNRYNTEWNYQLGRDKLSDSRYNTEWDYKKQQDALSQSNWERQFAKSGSSGGGGSSGYGSGSTKDNVWGAFANAMGSDARSGNRFLRENQEDIIEAVGKTEYNKMQAKADQVWEQNKRNERYKRSASRGY